MSMEFPASNEKPVEVKKSAEAKSSKVVEVKKEGEILEEIREELDRAMTVDEEKSLAAFEDRLAILRLEGKEAFHPEAKVLDADIKEVHDKEGMRVSLKALHSLGHEGYEQYFGTNKESPRTKYMKALAALKNSI